MGLASSHSPQVSMTPNTWALRGEADKHNPFLRDFSGKPATYEELLEQAPASMVKEITLEKFQATRTNVSVLTMNKSNPSQNAEGLHVMRVTGPLCGFIGHEAEPVE